MNQYVIAALIVMSLLLTGAGFALKKQIEVNGAQAERIKEQGAALIAAEEARKQAEEATKKRDNDLSKITENNRRLQNEIAKSINKDFCAGRDIPIELDQLLRQLAPKADKGLPPSNPSAGAPHSALGG